MDALQRLRAFDAARREGREFRTDAGLLTEVQEAASLSRYDWKAGELVAIVEPDGTRFEYRHGEDGRLLAVDRNGTAWASYAYDDAGRLTSARRVEGRMDHDYDAAGRLIRTRRGAAGPWLYRWANGRVSEARSDRESTAFEYDAGGRLTGLVQRVDGVTLSVRTEFDATGRIARIDFPEWRQQIGFSWDERGRASALAWNGEEIFQLGSDDATRLAWNQGPDGVRARTWHEAPSGRPLRQQWLRDGGAIHTIELARDAAFRLSREGERRYSYDVLGRLTESSDPTRTWRYHYDAADNVTAADDAHAMQLDASGRVRIVRTPTAERVYRYDDAGDLESVVIDGECVARFTYDHKGRLVAKQGRGGTERYLYGADDGLLAVADAKGQPLYIVLRLPTGIVGLIDFRAAARGEVRCLHLDSSGNLIFSGAADGNRIGPLAYDPFGLPLAPPPGAMPIYRGRFWQGDVGLYRVGCRWYDPQLRRFLTADTYTGAPDDARLVSPFVNAAGQRPARHSVLAGWLREPRLRNRFAYCANDPVNRFDPDGHWSFGGVLLSLLGVLWTLPNTAIGLAIEVTCLIGEVVRWLVYAVTIGNVSWQTPGFGAAASGRLDAFALVFKGGWFGSLLQGTHALAMTFGNVFFVNDRYQEDESWKALPDPVFPPSDRGSTSVPKADALYEHELRHVNQYGWFGPFYLLGLPLFGVYEWDLILHGGYWTAKLEQDARDHGGF